ncbi:tetratricopeptide repeat protein [Spirochaeta lutea]|uniref:Uncharacterized protein n=1 Tax=Spirochaeta lutea TaxID=1480694 RepID=A0A098R0D2_9SPIO|nr:tetratricopeptide repeat protein [Spirochaeta lutea]KGE73379.1 hypothetical protein DC28_03635 [Spirochaeta lutea]
MKVSVALAQDYFHRRDFPAAEAVIEDLLHEDPGNVEALTLLGSCFLREQRIFDARQTLEQCITLEPEHFTAHLELARVYGLLSDHRMAELHYLIALSMDAASLEAMLGLACLHAHRGNHHESALWFELAWALYPNDGIGLDLAEEYEQCWFYSRSHRMLQTLKQRSGLRRQIGASHQVFGRPSGEADKSTTDLEAIIDYRSQRMRQSFRLHHGFSFDSAMAMVHVLRVFMNLDPERILAVGRECEVLALSGSEGFHESVTLHSLESTVPREHLTCYWYAAYQLVEPKRPVQIDLRGPFGYALEYLENEA